MKENKCLFPQCQKPTGPRGLCLNHYASALNLVKKGRTSWEKLEMAGKSIPKSGRAGGAATGWFLGDK